MSVYVLVFSFWVLFMLPDVVAEAGPRQLITLIHFVPVVGGIILALV
eukprot:CAMPEP_0179349552 /NCGR_PEP_ID=MMETSP0797-20121207/74294_1 /TAXON_ID=47934 /ORGANISM="Dinophysis acuminata, Strain DAEP01" /LENGTH=46 /DNA_ID= /DNA_START= /DNA_END= /DNA_ORIENTATION=